MPIKEKTKKEIKWLAPEFEYFAKGVSWFWLVIIISIIIMAIALWQKNFLFFVFVIIATFLILFWGKQIPRDIEFTLDEHGLDIEKKKFYPFYDFEGFAVKPPIPNEKFTDLILKFRRRLRPYLKIRIELKNIDKIKQFVNQRLPEIEYEESLADHLAKILRF